MNFLICCHLYHKMCCSFKYLNVFNCKIFDYSSDKSNSIIAKMSMDLSLKVLSKITSRNKYKIHFKMFRKKMRFISVLFWWNVFVMNIFHYISPNSVCVWDHPYQLDQWVYVCSINSHVKQKQLLLVCLHK